MMKLDRIQVARRQLGVALQLFLENRDPVSVHVLACGGGEIAEHLTRIAGSNPFSDHFLATFPDMKIGDVRKLRNQYWNAFKHATTRGERERDDKELLLNFDDIKNDHALFIGWYDLGQATGHLPIEAQVFEAWYFAMYPEKANPDADITHIRSLFAELTGSQRTVQKAKLRSAIAWARQRQDIMADTRTDGRPLILDNP